MKLLRLLTANLGTKLMALLLAVIVWFYINKENTAPPVTFDVPLKLETADGITSRVEDVLTNKMVNTIQITLEGPRGVVPDKPTNIVCLHKVAVTNPSDQPVPQIEDLKPADFNLPESINIKVIQPAKIRVWLVKEIEKNLQVDTDKTKCLTGEPAKGYRVDKVRTDPTQILVRGPKHILHGRLTIPCEPLDVTGLTASFSRTGHIVGTIDNMPVFTGDSFKVMVDIAEELVTTTVKANINILIPPGLTYQVKTNPEQVDVKLKGPASSITALKKTSFNIYVNVMDVFSEIKDVKPGSYTSVTVRFQLSEDAPRGIILAEPLNQVIMEISELPKPSTPTPPGGG